MIITEFVEINNKYFKHTYSNSGFFIARNGMKFIEAIDLLENDFEYIETNESYLPDGTTWAEYQILLERLEANTV